MESLTHVIIFCVFTMSPLLDSEKLRAQRMSYISLCSLLTALHKDFFPFSFAFLLFTEPTNEWLCDLLCILTSIKR